MTRGTRFDYGALFRGQPKLVALAKRALGLQRKGVNAAPEEVAADWERPLGVRDFRVTDRGTIWQFTICSANARKFVEDYVEVAGWQWIGPVGSERNSFGVPRAQARTFFESLVDEGFDVCVD